MTSPGVREGALFISTMITSKDNEKLKLIRKLAERKHRDRERPVRRRGRGPGRCGARPGWEAEFVLRSGEDVEPELLDAVSALGSGTRVIGVYRQRWAQAPPAPAVYLHGVGDPEQRRHDHPHRSRPHRRDRRARPGRADPYSPKAVRASMGSIFAQPLVRAGVEATPAPRCRARRPRRRGALAPLRRSRPSASAPSATGCPRTCSRDCERRWTIPLRPGGAESLNVAAAAAIALGRISSATLEGGEENP